MIKSQVEVDMSGHSKWSTIKRQKGSQDARRGLTFSKLARAITVVAKGGGDPETNFKLRLAIEQAKAANMPKETIRRAIQHGAGKEGREEFEEASYEGYGPSGVAILVETLTDNKKRTISNLKNIFERGGGSLTSPGSVVYQFEKMGMITIGKPKDVDKAMLSLIDLGVEDVEEATDAIEVYTKPADLDKFRAKLGTLGFEILESQIFMRPKTVVAIKEKREAEKILRLMENLEAQEDVQRVFANFDIKEYLVSH